jgi:hypothetical protein
VTLSSLALSRWPPVSMSSRLAGNQLWLLCAVCVSAFSLGVCYVCLYPFFSSFSLFSVFLFICCSFLACTCVLHLWGFLLVFASSCNLHGAYWFNG